VPSASVTSRATRRFRWLACCTIYCVVARPRSTAWIAAFGLHRLLGARTIAAACRHYAAEPLLALAAVGLILDNE